MAKITAVIDIGSNSARMAIFKKTSRLGFYLLREEKSKVRISEGAYENNGNLQDFAIRRAVKALREFLLIAKSLKTRKILVVATSAVRDAPNKQEFLSIVKKELGLKIKIIDGNKEAYFGALAAANLLFKDDGVTIDIGGGSTEFAVIKNRKIITTQSLNLGSVRLKELFFDKNDIEGAKKYINSELSKLDSSFKYSVLFGIGGNIRALTKVIMKEISYPLDILHGFTYSVKDYFKFLNSIIRMSDKDLLKIGIKKERLDVIRPGTLIFVEALKYLEAKEVITSGVGVREGVFLYDLLRSDNFRFPSNFNPSVRTIIDMFNIRRDSFQNEIRIGMEVFDLLKKDFNLNEKFKFHLKYAIKLSRAGEWIDFYESHKHTDYIILNALHYGFSHEDRLLISKIIRFYKRTKIKKKEIENISFLLPKKDIIEKLSQILWISKILNQTLSCKNISISYKNRKLIVRGKNLYLASEKIRDKSLFFDIEIMEE